MRGRFGVLLFSLSLAFGCAEDPPGGGGPGDPDSGVNVSPQDGGDHPGDDAGLDAGGAGEDGGSVEDGGAGGDAAASDGATTDGGPTEDGGPVGPIALDPAQIDVPLGGEAVFTLSAPAGASPVWSVDGVAGGSAATGLIAALADAREARYTAPLAAAALPVMHTVTAELGGSTAQADLRLVHPAPVIVELTPPQVVAGSPGTQVTIRGSGFTTASQVLLDGVGLARTLVDPGTLRVEIPAALIAFASQRQLAVENPAPGGGVAQVAFNVALRETVVPPDLAPVVPLFEGATLGTNPARQPRITYPEDGSVAPRDFPSPVVSWDQPPPNNVCRLRLESLTTQVDLYAAPNPNRPARVNTSTSASPLLWTRISNTAFSGVELTLTVTCAEVSFTPGGAPILVDGQIHTSAPVRYTVSEQAAGGRIVYFSGLIEGLWRIDIGSSNATGMPWIGPDPAFGANGIDTSPGCVGCHSFSRDGRRMAFVSNAVVWNVGIASIAQGQPSLAVPAANGGIGNWTATHPTEDYVLSTSLQADLSLHDATNGQVLSTVPTFAAGPRATQPAWSPSGDRFAFVTGDIGADGVADFANGEIWSMTFTSSAGVTGYGAPVRLAQPAVPGGSAYYPSYSPDGQWIVFAQAPSGSSYNNPLGDLWLMSADGAVGPIPLARANRTGAIYNSWPRWAPSSQPGRYWVIFSSQRPYPPLNGTGPQQLWVTRIDTTRLPADPSSPAIWLSGQQPFTGNLTAEWTVEQ